MHASKLNAQQKQFSQSAVTIFRSLILHLNRHWGYDSNNRALSLSFFFSHAHADYLSLPPSLSLSHSLSLTLILSLAHTSNYTYPFALNDPVISPSFLT